MQARLTEVERYAENGGRLFAWIMIGWIALVAGGFALIVIHKASTQPEPVEKCVPDQFGRGCEVTVEREQNPNEM